VLLALPLVLFGTAASWLWARPLDLMLSGEDEAASLGVDVRAVQRWCIVWTAVLTGAAVAVGGNIGFVGLIVPHAARRFVGVSHRLLVPVAALGGGAFVVACDLLARLVPGRSELPLGVITGLIGAPLFLTILLRSGREPSHG
jgi:iron complex transport system permease protein